MPFNIPNLFTWLRIILIPVFVAVFYLSDQSLSPHLKNLISTGVFLLAALTDWLDGYLARKLDQTSAFGAFLDPVADKLMVAAALIILVKLGRADAIISFIIIGVKSPSLRCVNGWQRLAPAKISRYPCSARLKRRCKCWPFCCCFFTNAYLAWIARPSARCCCTLPRYCRCG